MRPVIDVAPGIDLRSHIPGVSLPRCLPRNSTNSVPRTPNCVNASRSYAPRSTSCGRSRLQRRDEVRQLVADLPTVVSRRTVVREMLREGVNHPDKPGVLRRAVRKLGRAPRKAWRMITRSQ